MGINLNSPTVQAMLNNTPYGVGNLPVYFGSAPTVTGTVESVQNNQQVQQQMPFPSPKEMLANGGQSMIYSPTTFAPQNNIVGGYNPSFNAAFSGYSNPYMGIGSYGGFPSYNYGYGYSPFPQYMQPMDDDARDRLMRAEMNGLTYDEQLQEDSNILKTMSRIVSKNLGRTEEEAKECERTFDIYNKYPKQEQQNPYDMKPLKTLHIQIKIGDEVVADFDPETTQIRHQDYNRNASTVEMAKYRNEYEKSAKIHRCNQLYGAAPERRFDHTEMVDFFNNGAGVVMADMMTKEMYSKLAAGVSQLYDNTKFRQQLFENNGIRTKAKKTAIERFTGRYGVMPDGRPVSPGNDPAVAESFSYNPATGQYTVTAPNFIQNRLEQARQSFIRSLGEG